MRTVLVSLAVLAAFYCFVLLVLLLPNVLVLFKGLIRDERVPRGSKALLVLGAAWVASPIDLIPEFIPFLGPLDDAVVAALVLRHVLRTAGDDVIAERWRGEPETLNRLLRFSARQPR
jgi:uncharacterized membrane protein YkvA (DUF1232 family)